MNIVNQIFKLRLLIFFSAIVVTLSAYKKEIVLNEKRNLSILINEHNYSAKVINVSNVAELYLAVNNPANTDTRIVMASGTYTLDSSLDPTHLITKGRLELQAGMELRGQPGHPNSVIIDESGLSRTSFALPVVPGAPAKTGGIRIGRGFNSIEWITVIGNSKFDSSANPKTPFALSVIDTDLDSDSTHVRLGHLVVKNGSQIGIDIRNGGAGRSGRFIEADIFDNDIFDNKDTANKDASGNGITIQNSVGATGAIIVANLAGNYVHGNNTGLRSHNQHTNSGSITINSTADRFDENGIGIILNAGLDINNASSVSTANNNFLSFEAHASSIRKNVYKLPPDNPPPCGTFGAGGVATQVSNRASNNILNMKLYGCFISGNQGPEDIDAFGARSGSPTIQSGTNNLVTIELVGITKNAKVKATASDPVDPTGTNVVNVF